MPKLGPLSRALSRKRSEREVPVCRAYRLITWISKAKRCGGLVAAAVALCSATFGSPAIAGPQGDANAGLDALNAGNNSEAVRLLTRALSSGRLSRSDRELAYVKRAEAYLAEAASDKALADAKRALGLSSSDSEAADVRDRAQAALASAPPPTVDDQAAQAAALNSQVKSMNDGIAARNQAAQDAYNAQVAQYEAKKQADQDDYAASVAAYQAQVAATEQKRAADLAAWQARVQACKNGDVTQCGN